MKIPFSKVLKVDQHYSEFVKGQCEVTHNVVNAEPGIKLLKY